MYAALPISPLQCLSAAKIVRPLDIQVNTPSLDGDTCVNCPCLQSDVVRVHQQHHGPCSEEGKWFKEPSIIDTSRLGFSAAYKEAIIMQDNNPTGFISAHVRKDEDSNPWHINRQAPQFLRCNNSNTIRDYTSVQANMDILTKRSVMTNQRGGLEKAVDTIADKMAPLSIPSIQVTSPPRSPRVRHRLEMPRKKDLSVDRSEVSTMHY